MASKIRKAQKDEALAAIATIEGELWRRGDLTYKLKPCQKKMFDDIFRSNHFKYVIKCARRLGKSYLLCSISVMLCLSKKFAQVRYAAPTNRALKEILLPIMRKICEDAPKGYRPRFYSSDSAFKFPITESVIQMSGVNSGHGEKLRGNACDLFIIDEAGTVDDLHYLVNDIALPQLLDPDGRILDGRRLILSSSPPRTPAHEFTEIARSAELEGNYSHYDIFAGGYPDSTIEMFRDEAGGENSTTWKREYLALDVIDENYALIPEWKDNYISDPQVDEYFKFYQKYESLDVGVRDLTVCLFAHYDFKASCLYIHDEIVMNGPQMTTDRLAEAIKGKEGELFGELVVHKRVSDVELLLLNDLSKLHNLYFIPSDKGRLEEMVNEVRIWVNAGRIRVSPRCKQLIGCLSYGIWNEKRTDFDRLPKYGHFDALAALMYLVRNVDVHVNPVPATYGKPESEYFYPEDPKKNDSVSRLREAFKIKERNSWR